jgi:ribosome-binding factor A
MPGDVKRAVRVAERIREELAVLVSQELGDPRVDGVIVSGVRVSDDLRSVRVRFRLLEGADAARRKTASDGLVRASGFLRREVAQRAGLRFVPELTFFYDEGQEARDRVDELLEEVRREKPTGGG